MLNLDIKEIRRLYIEELKTLQEIADLKGTTKKSISNWLIRHNIPRRNHKTMYNTKRNNYLLEYFKDWGNQSAYIVGYIYADGSIDIINPKSKGLELACDVKDREIIDCIAKELNLTNLVKIYSIKSQILLNKYLYNNRQMCRLKVYNNDFIELLELYGIKSRKTWLDYPLPNIPDTKICHFLRGVFDGDGCISFTSNEKYSVTILGPITFITNIRDYLCSKLNINNVQVEKRKGCYSIKWSGVRCIKLLYKFLYPEGQYIYLKRKRNLFEEVNKCFP